MSEVAKTPQPQVQYAALTDIGMRRANNQDSHAVVPAAGDEQFRERGYLFIVADGMGAHAAGELASKMAVERVSHLYHKYAAEPITEALHKAITEANAEIHRRGMANNEFRSMGTTLSTLVLAPFGALVAHVGDSRVYRLRGRTLQQLTFDHSLVWELRRAGQASGLPDISPSVPKNVITRSLGPNETVQVDLEGPLPVASGDTFLLCSDGLTGRVRDEEIAAILCHLDPQDAVRLLVNMANLRGGPDNITVIVARVGAWTANSAAVEPAPTKTPPTKTPPRKDQDATHPAVLVFTAVCLLAAVAMLAAGNLLAAAIMAMGGLAMGGCGYLARQVAERRKLSRAAVLHGAAPYAEADSPPPEKMASSLAVVTREMRNSPVVKAFELDWDEFDAMSREVESASAPTDERIRALARAVDALMKQVREHMNRTASDSAIDL